MPMARALPCPPDRPATTADSPDLWPGPPTQPAVAQRRWRSRELFGQAQEVEIEHGGSVYRLRLTALGKLILTK